MDKRRLIAVVAVTAALGAVAALTVPAIAATGASPTPGGEPFAATAPAADQMIPVLRRDLGLSTEQARTRLLRESWATRTAQTLRRQLGASFGGVWLTADAGQLMVAVTDAAQAGAVRAAGAQPKVVARSAAQLDTVKADLDGARAPATVQGWYVDPATNSVVLLARPGTGARALRFATARGVDAAAVRLVTSTESPRPLFDVRGADPYFIDNRARCSIGFSVLGGFVSAGHCGQPGSTTTGFNQQAQGTFRQSTFPGNGDFSFVEVNGDWTPQPVVNDFNGGTITVAGSAEAPVGASVCRSGSTTGTHCGLIQAKNATVNYPEGTVTGLTRTNVCAEAGDSGGSWMSGDQAQGVTSGGSGDCTVGGTTFFQPLNEILSTDNLTLVVAGGGTAPSTAPSGAEPSGAEPSAAPTASAPPADDTCTGARVRGSLRAGDRTVEPNGRFFRAAAGRHTACLTGPAGANFDLALQQWNGRSWQTVARAAGPDAAEQLTFDGRAGFFRYRVQSVSGSGGYVLTINAP
jgi:streptogrisin C